MKVHKVTVRFGVPPLKLENVVYVHNAAARDSVITWAREAGHEVSWSEVEVPRVLNADEAIEAVKAEIEECKNAIL